MLTAGIRVTGALAERVGSATLVAFTMTVCGEAIAEGASYRPAETKRPTPSGIKDHVTAVFDSPVAVALNWSC